MTVLVHAQRSSGHVQWSSCVWNSPRACTGEPLACAQILVHASTLSRPYSALSAPSRLATPSHLSATPRPWSASIGRSCTTLSVKLYHAPSYFNKNRVYCLINPARAVTPPTRLSSKTGTDMSWYAWYVLPSNYPMRIFASLWSNNHA